jgi:hypothetical protein
MRFYRRVGVESPGNPTFFPAHEAAAEFLSFMCAAIQQQFIFCSVAQHVNAGFPVSLYT